MLTIIFFQLCNINLKLSFAFAYVYIHILCCGTATQEEAAMAYDMAAIEHRGLNAVTNFDISRYINWLGPNIHDNQENRGNPRHQELTPSSELELGFVSNQLDSTTGEIVPDNTVQSGGGTSTSSALELLLQSPKFKEMLEMTSAEDCPQAPLKSNPTRRTFPEDIQTCFESEDSGTYSELSDDIIFGDLSSFEPIFHFELDA